MFTISSNKFPPPRAVATRRINAARHWTLPLLFILALTALILAVIYTYCVGQNNHQRTELLESRQTAPHYHRSVEDFTHPSLYSRTSTTSSNSTVNQKPSVSLLFYSMTLPLATLTHTTIEATLLKWNPQLLTHPTAKLPLLSVPYFLLASTVLLAYGWATTSAFWTHCELSLTDSGICPPQVRNHLMYGILELSIAKAAIGWLLVIGYVVHGSFLVRWIRVVRRWQGISGWAGQLEWEPEDKEGMDLGELKGVEDVDVKAKVNVATVVAAAQEARAKQQQEEKEKRERHGPPKVVPSFPPPPTKPTK